jgi:hypothetical protein
MRSRCFEYKVARFNSSEGVQMRISLIVALLVFTSQFVFADEMPIGMRLKRAGYTDCSSLQVFNAKFDCGEDYAQTFSCNKSSPTGPIRVVVLALGVIASDVGGTCQPVRVINRFIEAKTDS